MSNKLSLYKAFSLIELSIVILIIGILVAGVTSSSRLIKRMKIITVQNLTRNSPVISIKDLNLWYETSLDESFINTEEVNGSGISRWFDSNSQSSFKIDSVQSTLNNQPTYFEDAINGLPAIKFDGLANYFVTQDFNFNNNKITVFMVAKRISGNDSGTATLVGFDPARVYDWNDTGNFKIWEVSSVIRVWRGVTTGQIELPLATVNHTGNNVPYIYSTTIDGVNNISYLNGVQSASVSTTGNIIMKNLYIGCRYLGSPTIFYNGFISEIIIYSRSLSTEERKSVEGYLGKKYNIKVN